MEVENALMSSSREGIALALPIFLMPLPHRLYAVKSRFTDTRLIRTSRYNGQFAFILGYVASFWAMKSLHVGVIRN